MVWLEILTPLEIVELLLGDEPGNGRMADKSNVAIVVGGGIVGLGIIFGFISIFCCS